jgi:hypothetical protein
MLLLMAIHFHANQLTAIVDLACQVPVIVLSIIVRIPDPVALSHNYIVLIGFTFIFCLCR